MEPLLQLLSAILGFGLIYTLVPLTLKALIKKMPPKKGKKAKKLNFSSNKGWYGVKPTSWDWLFLVFILSVAMISSLLIILMMLNIKQQVLKFLFFSRGDFMVFDYSPNLSALPSMLLGLFWGFGISSLLVEISLRFLSALTGKTRRKLIPALYNQSAEGLGLDEKKLSILLYGKIGGLLLIVTILSQLGGYTRFTNSGIVHRDWPGLVEREYDYGQVQNIWLIDSYQNRVTQKVESGTNFYVVVFDDGWQWKTTNLLPGFVSNYSRNGNEITDVYILEFLVEKTGIEPKRGIKNIDVD